MFDSAKLKVERANQHIDNLNTVFHAFARDSLQKIWIKPDEETGKINLGVKFAQSPPPHINTIAGDAIHNLRTALDHLACALVRENGGTITGNHGFPFHEDQANFEANFEGKIKGATKEAIDLIKAVEPYNGGKGTELWLLNKLDVADKHHSLIFAMRVVVLPKIIVSKPNGDVVATLTNCLVGGDGRVKMASFPADSRFEIENKDKIPVGIVFNKPRALGGREVISFLKNASQMVLGIIETFEAQFS